MDPFEPRRLTASDVAAAAAVIRIAFAEQGAVTDPPSSALGETAEIVADKLGSGGGAGLEHEGALIGHGTESRLTIISSAVFRGGTGYSNSLICAGF
jgi:hypothetical protein